MTLWQRRCLWQATYLGLLVCVGVTVLVMVLTGHSLGAGALAWLTLSVYTLGLAVAAWRRSRARRRVVWETRFDRYGRPFTNPASDQHKQDLKTIETLWRAS